MWKLAYNIAIHCAFPFFSLFALTRKKIRKTFLQRLSIKKGPEMRDVLWIHAASVGEAVIAENLVNYMVSRTSFSRFVITTNTDYTRDLLMKRFDRRVQVLYLPFDLPCAVNRFMKGSTFMALIIIETELWPNLIWAAQARKIPVIIANGRISDRTVRNYRSLSFFLRHVLSSIDLVLAQSHDQAARFISIGMDPSRVIDVGNLKYYRFLDHLPDASSKENLIVFGSIKEKELPIILPLIEPLRKEFPGHAIYLVPRDLSLVNTLETELSEKLRVSRFSALKDSEAGALDAVIVDTIGDLVSLYSKSLVAFVGGSLAPYGGQNLLEPLFFATPVLFGPHIENFREIADTILSAKAGMLVHDGRELLEAITAFIKNPQLRQTMGDAGLRIIREQEAVMTQTVTLITEVIWKNSAASRR